ncbi:MAG: murein biosynthesis integral membrane protein MurJ [Acidobacteria bacterium 37-71-11]|nr:MAG: murein biosynthesis integral membrane protein MurJ [Acidobacteria bacterium 37-71-11]
MTTKRRLVTATGGMAAVTVASRFSGLVRDNVIARLLGAGMVSDAFVTAFRIPNMFRAFLAEGTLHAAFIPTLAELKRDGDPAKAREFVRAMTSVLLIALPVIVALGILAAPLLVTMVAAAFARDPAQFELAVKLTRIMFPYLGLVSLAALAQGVLNASDRFLLPAAAPIAVNLCIVAGTVTGVVVFGGRPEWMGVGVLAGGLVQFGLQWLACRDVGLALVPGRQAFSHPEVRRVLRLMLPGVPALGVYQVTLLLSNQLAASLGKGAVFCVYNASRLNELVYGVLIVQLTTAVLPMLAAERVADEGKLFGGGKYTIEAVHTTAGALVMYSLGLPFLGLSRLLANTSYAWKDTRSPLIAAVSSLVVFGSLGLVLTRTMGVAGIAAAASCGQVANTLTLVWLDGRHRRLPRLRDVLPATGRHLIAAAGLGVVAFSLNRLFPVPLHTSVRSLVQLGAFALATGAVYLALLVAVGAPEWREAREFLRRRRAA